MNCDDLIGKPFKYGGRGPDEYDCYGLVREIHLRRGIQIPDYRSASDMPTIVAQIMAGVEVWTKVEEPIGSVALFRLSNGLHVGYMLSSDRMIHTWEKSGGVCVERMSDWRHRVVGYYVFL